MAKVSNIGNAILRPMPHVKRTSQGGRFKPKNKHKRKNFKAYKGQG